MDETKYFYEFYFRSACGVLFKQTLEEHEVPWPCWFEDDNGKAYPSICRDPDFQLAGSEMVAGTDITHVGTRMTCWPTDADPWPFADDRGNDPDLTGWQNAGEAKVMEQVAAVNALNKLASRI
jgi:hypothetical protein